MGEGGWIKVQRDRYAIVLILQQASLCLCGDYVCVCYMCACVHVCVCMYLCVWCMCVFVLCRLFVPGMECGKVEGHVHWPAELQVASAII